MPGIASQALLLSTHPCPVAQPALAVARDPPEKRVSEWMERRSKEGLW